MSYRMLVIAIHSIVPLSLFNMHHAPPFISSDNYVYSLSEEKINASRFLIIAHLKNEQSAQPISLDFPQSSLNLFFDAYDARHNFVTFFNNLCPKQQTTLISLAGKTQLNSPLITSLALQLYCGKSIISSLMPSHMEMDTVINYLYNKMVEAYVKGRQPIKKKKNSPFQVFTDYRHQHNKQIETCINKQKNSIHTHQPRKNNTYYLMSSNKKVAAHELWVTDEYGHISNKQNLPLSSPITQSAFSPNGHYLFTYSHDRASTSHTSYLFTLATAKKNFKHKCMAISTTAITSVLFNPQSTHLIVGSQQQHQATLTIYNASQGDIVHTTPMYGNTINSITCNPQGTRMLICSHDDRNGTYTLWNTENWDDITVITEKYLSEDKTALYPCFNNNGNILAILTNKGSLIFLNSLTGTSINQSTQKKWFSNSKVNTIFTPDDYFCIVHTISPKKNSDCVSLWNTATGTLVNYLIWKQSRTAGIGLSADKSYLVVTSNNTALKRYTCKKVSLLHQNDIKCLTMIQKKSSLHDMYALYHAYQAAITNQQPSAEIVALLKQFPQKPYDIRTMVLSYLLEPTNTGNQATEHR